jgi:hypothetical protein
MMGGFLSPRSWPADASARRLAMAIGAALGTLALGIGARPLLPALGSAREGPGATTIKMPLGWRRTANEQGDRVSYTNGLTGAFRSSATLVQGVPCRGRACSCDKIVQAIVEQDLWRLADLGGMRKLEVGASVAPAAPVVNRVDGTLAADEGRAEVSAVCLPDNMALIVMQPPGGSATLATRMAATLR